MGDGVKQYRMILNVKEPNHDVQYSHIKMDSLESCLTLIEHDCFMAIIDMEDAYHSFPIHPDYTKYLKFTVSAVSERLYKYLGDNSPSLLQASSDGLHLIRTKIKRSGVSRNALKTRMNSWVRKLEHNTIHTSNGMKAFASAMVQIPRHLQKQ